MRLINTYFMFGKRFAFRYANVELNDFSVICSLARKGLIGQLT